MSYQSIQEMFTGGAARFGHHTAIEHGRRRLTYAELEAESNRLANFLRAGGAGRGSIVGLFTDDPVQVITGILGVLKAGAVFVPLDPTFPDGRLRTMAAQVNPECFLVKGKHLAKLRRVWGESGARARVICLDGAAGAALTEGDDEQPHGLELTTEFDDYTDTRHPGLDYDPDAPCSVYFTSGSTGRPKAILGRLKGIDHFMRWEIEAVGAGPGIRVSQLALPSFDGFLKDAFVPLCAGGTVCAPESRDLVLHPERLIDWLDVEQVEVLHCVPSVFRALLNQRLNNHYFEAMRCVVLTGEPLYPADVKRWRDIFSERIKLLNIYGTTETSMSKFAHEVVAADADRPSVPVGRPIKGAAVIIMDSALRPCHEGAVGEIYIRTPYRSHGYYNEPELTREVFIPNPFSDNPSDVIHRTGDYGRLLEGGELEILGRRDQQVKVRGVRVELGEIENLLRGHEAVADMAVVDREDAEGNKFLVAYVTMSNGTRAEELRPYLAERLPEAMLPSAFVELEQLPRTLNGKIDRKALPSLKSVQAERDAGELVLRTPVEELVAGIWCEVLRLPAVGRGDNFFNLGGHSLLATQVLLRVRECLEVELPVRSMFESSTVAQLSLLIQEQISEGRQRPLEHIRPVPREGGLPLSFAQQRLWFQAELARDTTTFHIPLTATLRGRLNAVALEQTFSEIIRRHENLRTSFPRIDGELVQSIRPPARFIIPIVDLRSLPDAAAREAVSKSLAEAEFSRPFDMESGPLVRVALLRHSEEEHTIICTMHHIISDGWSKGVLVKEVSALYGALCQGEPSPLAELAIQYTDFAAWQRQQLQGDALEQELSYWRGKLADAPPLLHLATDRPRPPVRTYRGAAEPLKLSTSLSNDLKALSRRRGATLFMTLLAAFKALLYRYTAQEDIVVGTTIANRERPEIEGLIGFFVNRLAIRTDCSGNPSFEELLGQVRETTLKAYAHQTMPFEKLVQELQPKRNPSYAPLFQVVFGFHNIPTLTALTLPGLTLDVSQLEITTSECDLLLDLGEGPEGLVGALLYNRDLFDRGTVARMVAHFKTLLEGVASHPEQRLSELPLLGKDEKAQTSAEWSQTRAEYAHDVCFHELFDAQVARTPNVVAVSFEDQQLSYAELQRRANQLAHYLRKVGVGAETPVAIYLERSLETIVAILGVLKAGGAYLPLDSAHPQGRVRYMLEDSQTRVVLTQKRLAAGLAEYSGLVLCLDSDWHLVNEEPEVNPAVPMSAENLAYVIYTSGSTGRAKGVMIRHQSVINLATSLREIVYAGSEPHLRVSLNAPLTFDSSVKQLVQLLFGHEVCIIPEDVRTDGDKLRSYLALREVDVLDCTPAQLRLLLAGGPSESEARTPPLLLVGGEAIDEEMWQMLAADGRTASFNVYGPTECTVDTTVCRIQSTSPEPSIGHPLGNVQTYLLDKDGCQVPVGVRAELYIGGAGLARGYLWRPDLTAERFLPDPFSGQSGARVYRTGDLARCRVGGEIHFLGRADYQVKIRGHRVEPGEVEAALRREPQIVEAVVLDSEDQPGNRRLVAYVVLADGSAMSIGGLQRTLKEHLPDYMVPTAWVLLDKMPLMSNGKVDRLALPAPSAQERRYLDSAYEEPQTQLEAALAVMWQEVLRVEEVGIYDDFFELGGHSLLAIQIMNRVKETFHIDLPMRAIFHDPTIVGLSSFIEETLIEKLEAMPESN